MLKRYFLLLSLFLAGCAGTPDPASRYKTGKCFWWGSVEAEFARTPYDKLCKKPVMVEGIFIACCRKKNHRGAHHSHTDRDCLAVYR